jgi:hypothetical protein
VCTISEPWQVPAGSAGHRPAAPRWPVDYVNRLVVAAGGALKNKVYWRSPQDAILPAAMAAYDGLHTRRILHGRVLHIASSQAFAINLFGPLNAESAAALMREMGLAVDTADAPLLEYTDQPDRMSEASDASRHLTQVDVLLRGTTSSGERMVALVEVKLTEADFGGCSAYQDHRNDRRAVCAANGPFGGDPGACFQLRTRDADHPPRRYAQLLALPAGNPQGGSWSPDGGCPFRLGNQPMRNTALAAALIADNEVQQAVVALCAPAGYTAMWRRWAEAKHALNGVTGVGLQNLTAETVLEIAGHPEADIVRGRYLLAPAPRR